VLVSCKDIKILKDGCTAVWDNRGQAKGHLRVASQLKPAIQDRPGSWDPIGGILAIYHLSTKTVARVEGRSAVAATAYRSNAGYT
jgi:hypothetical protein